MIEEAEIDENTKLPEDISHLDEEITTHRPHYRTINRRCCRYHWFHCSTYSCVLALLRV